MSQPYPPSPHIKRGHFSLRVTILTMMVSILALLAAGMLVLSHRAGRDVVLAAARDHMATVETLVAERLADSFGQVEAQIPLLASLPVLREPPRAASHLAEHRLHDLMSGVGGIHHLFVLYPDGTFLRFIDIADATPEERTALAAPPMTQTITQIRFQDRDGIQWTQWRYENAAGITIDARLESGTHDGVSPPDWVKDVLDAGKLLELGPRRTRPSGQPALTLAAPVEGGNGAVVGVDISLSRLSAFLADHRPTADSRLVVLNKRGDIIASQDEDTLRRLRGEESPDSKLPPVRLVDMGDPVLDALRIHFLEAGTARELNLDLDGEEWTVRLMPLTHVPHGISWIVLATPIAEVVGPLIVITRMGAWYSIAVICAAIPLVMLASTLIASPLRRLTRSAETIRAMDLSTPVTTRSRITEVDHLALTMEAMRSGVETFTKYVPRTLVTRAIASGRGADRGGDRREATLLFSDVEGFTTLADGRDPEQTMADASAYFEVLGQAIQDGGGVIDKFIGDAVMALWNAPETNPNHARDACRGLLGALRVVTRWNLERIHQGEPPFPTRFGLHTGPVIVGNLGTHDRLNYTAVGATVNTAARLEGLNKVYGTATLVGDTTRRLAEAADDTLLFRAVDRVVPKGARVPLEVHDLIDPTWEAMGIEELRAYIRDWDRAITLYRAQLWAEAEGAFRDLSYRRPRDPVADLYLTRIATWKAVPPLADWDATFHAESK
ncbi:adenylate/guanylate cyclase domain-containing protein [Rhodospirillum sp. A1_3_36]|uniref:adenylate/guanylate cyclase domain-containing protein n=1 Tax=Rhodospirillum sp. A1_3_36 TaxID=3391666 RepID=UPI0039A5069F